MYGAADRSAVCHLQFPCECPTHLKFTDVNTDIETMKSVVVKVMPRIFLAHSINCFQSIRAGQPLFFGSDVGKFSETSSGIMDTVLFEYEVCIYLRICSSLHSAA